MQVSVKVTTNISGTAVFRATNAPGGLVYNDVLGLINEIKAVGTVLAQKEAFGNPLDRLHDGQPVGRYVAGFYANMEIPSRNFVDAEVGNSAGHAAVVEEGRITTRKRQRFSWSQAWFDGVFGRNPVASGGFGLPGEATPGGQVGGPSRFRPGVIVRYKKIRDPGGIVSTKVTKGRPGKHILRRSGNAVLKRRGFSTL